MAGKHRGLRPPREMVARQREAGYLTPAAAAKKYGVNVKLVYKMRERWAPDAGDHFLFEGQSAAKRVGANVWVLQAAVEAELRSRGQLPAGRS